MHSEQQPFMPVNALRALEQGKKIEAIRMLREAQPMGLKEAKEAVEKYLDENPQLNQTFQQAA